MKIKDLLLPVGLALVTTWLIQYFFFGGKNATITDAGVRSGQQFVAPVSEQEARIINTDINPIDEKKSAKIIKTNVETDVASFVFSSDGASVERIDFKGAVNGELHAFGSVFPAMGEEKCFLVALDEKTPYNYQLLGKTEDDLGTQLHYRYESPSLAVVVDKIFTVYKKTHKIDIELEITPKEGLKNPVEARLFFPSPVMPELGDLDVVSSIVLNEKGAMQKTARAKINPRMGLHNPTLFGSDSKYFIHAMIQDPNGFAQRAYYKLADKNMLYSVIEGPSVKEKAAWKLSFYFGPKEEKAMANVDTRLEKTLDYSGLLAPISKFLLMLLKWLYQFLKNYGLAIIVLTLFIRLLLLPFSIRAEKGAKKQAEFQKKLQYLQQKYKHDKVALARERAELVRKHGMGLGSCLPVLLQIPVFFALSRVLMSSIELYKAPFLWIPDLSAKDPYYVLPILISGSMLVQASTMDAKQRMPIIVMAFAFGAFSSTFSSGLALYIFASTVLGLAQIIVQRKFK